MIVLEGDPLLDRPENQILKSQLQKLHPGAEHWRKIS
jgi:hypothetical protein